MERGCADTEHVALSIDLPSGHVIDAAGFERHAFTPYAVYEAGHGRRIQERTGAGLAANNWSDITSAEFKVAAATFPADNLAGRFRVLVGVGDTPAVAFKRREQRIGLLHLVAAGIETCAGEYHAARMWKHRTSGGNHGGRTFDVFKLATLQWRTVNAEQWYDFAQYIQSMYQHLDRYSAWLMAWTLVRAAYVDDLLSAEEILDAAAHASNADARSRGRSLPTFDSCLNMVVARLKAQTIT